MDGQITSSNNVRTLRYMATELRSKFPKVDFTELAGTEPEAWAKESFQIATKTADQERHSARDSEGRAKNCREVTDVVSLLAGYVATARQIADRRMTLAGYRLFDLLIRALSQ